MQSKKRLIKKGITVAVVAAVILVVWVYGSFDPADSEVGRFFPKCPVKLLTGLDCPSCGMQRSLHSLLHGDLRGALQCNWFIIFSLFYLFGVILSGVLCRPGSAVRRFFRGPKAAGVYIVAYFLWFILRNILGK